MGYWRTRRLKQKSKSGVISTIMGFGLFRIQTSRGFIKVSYDQTESLLKAGLFLVDMIISGHEAIPNSGHNMIP